MSIRILFVGDVVGGPGRKALERFLPGLRRKHDAVIVNAENAAGGRGLTPEIVRQIFDLGADAITTGNHVWDNRAVYSIIDKEDRLLRPLNYPEDERVAGRGTGLYPLSGGLKIGVVNLMGRVFMKPIDCPMRVGREAVESLREETPLILVDLHAEATSEKRATAEHLDGLATVVIGTHTHVQTSDEIVLEGGTAFITDAGMTGPHDSIIGVRKEIILEQFLTALPVRHKVATGDARLEGVSVEADEQSGRALGIERIRLTLD